MLDLVGKRFWYFLISTLIILPGVISLLIPPALKPGIEFTSGSLMTLRFEQSVGQEELRSEYATLGHADAVIQRTGQGDFIVRTKTLAPETKDSEGNVVEPAEKDRIEAALQQKFGPLSTVDFYSVSPTVAAELVKKAFWAILAAVVAILLYIAWAFRKLPNPFRYGISAIIAVVHDVLVVLGIFSILGKVFGTEIDMMFITAVLTVMGYSVHDTIVIFDRIRENVLKYGPEADFGQTVNSSILETLSRSLNTVLTVIFALVALYLFGGVTIREFILAMLIGVISGTYSSICTAAQIVVSWEKGDIVRILRHTPLRALVTRSAA
ncbi:MAG: protein translocase subunit SecF [Chloroflexi bacterium]|nr:protein translocase subunit SecF [Chloroflexota bacterium]